MQPQVSALKEQEHFIKDFILMYKSLSVLWDRNHPQYRDRSERHEAQEELLRKCQEYYPNADEDFVLSKINTLRTTFRREYKKVVASKIKSGKVYRPILWYYNLLLFLVGEETGEEEITSSTTTLKLSRNSWNREYSAILLGYLKDHPIMYSSSYSARSALERQEACRKITDDLIQRTGKLFHMDEVKRKIQMFKDQYRSECKKIRQGKKNYKPTLWCFELLQAVMQNSKSDDENKDNKRKRELEDSSSNSYHSDFNDEIEQDILNIKDENSTENTLSDNYDDIFDTIGKNVAHKLRQMSEEQGKMASKLVSDLMYHGLMEELTPRSHLLL